MREMRGEVLAGLSLPRRRKDHLAMCPLRARLLVSQRQTISLGPSRENEVWVRGVPSHPYLCQEWTLREPMPKCPQNRGFWRFARFSLTEAFGSKIQIAATTTDTKNIRLTK